MPQSVQTQSRKVIVIEQGVAELKIIEHPSLRRLTVPRIMLVDDEVDITLVLKKALERVGFDVIVFNNPLEVLSNFKADQFSLVILDIKMPNMDGFTLYEKLRQIDRDIKICFLTAYDAEYRAEFKRRFPNLDVKCFIQKPVSITTIIKMVKAELTLA